MKNNKGFTLVELLAVIIVLGILMTIATPVALKTIKKAKTQINKFNQEEIIDAGKMYLKDLDEGVTSYTLTSDAKINGESYVKGSVISPYTFRTYMYDVGSITVSIKDLVSQGYYNEGCDYTQDNKGCTVNSSCMVILTLKTELNSNGYVITKGYDAALNTSSNCSPIE